MEETMTDKEIITKWKAMSGIVSDELVGFFQAFRPNGDGLSKAFEGVEKADQILPRLYEIYRATTDGYPEDAYFVVRKPASLSKKHALDLAKTHLRNFEAIGKEIGHNDLVRFLQPGHRVEILGGERPLRSEQCDAEIYFDEMATDIILSLSPLKSQALLLREALYNVACDTYIRDYILWPLYQRSTSVVDLLGPYFNLWKHGVGICIESHQLLKLYVPLLV
jgi:hypothetical protein